MKRRLAWLAGLLIAAASASASTLTPARAGSWAEGTPMTTARAQGGAAVIDEEIFVVGGAGPTEPRSQVEAYNTIGDIWRSVGAMPAGVQQFGSAAIDGKLFVSGGYGKNLSEGASASLWIFDPLVGVWVEGAAMPGPRAGHRMAMVGGKLYVIGGAGARNGEVWAYDPDLDKWSVAPGAMPRARTDIAVAALGAKLYVVGGAARQGATQAVDIYDTGTGRWSAGPSLPKARRGHAAVMLNGRLHVVGGQALGEPKTFAEHFVLNLTSGKWSTAAPMPTPRHGAAAAAVRGKLYIIGGGTGAGVYTVFTESDLTEIYTPDRNE